MFGADLEFLAHHVTVTATDIGFRCCLREGADFCQHRLIVGLLHDSPLTVNIASVNLSGPQRAVSLEMRRINLFYRIVASQPHLATGRS